MLRSDDGTHLEVESTLDAALHRVHPTFDREPFAATTPHTNEGVARPLFDRALLANRENVVGLHFERRLSAAAADVATERENVVGLHFQRQLETSVGGEGACPGV